MLGGLIDVAARVEQRPYRLDVPLARGEHQRRQPATAGADEYPRTIGTSSLLSSADRPRQWPGRGDALTPLELELLGVGAACGCGPPSPFPCVLDILDVQRPRREIVLRQPSRAGLGGRILPPEPATP